MFRATLDDQGRWGALHAFGYNSDDYSTGHAALSADGHTIYFASDRPGGIGGSDIWRSVDLGDGFGAPENLGPTINTPGDELFPTIAGGALYFSSNAHTNMGGLDLFITELDGNGWAEPRNMGYPVNTRFDDFALTLNTDGKSGYLSSDRTGTDRVFQFFIQEPVFWVEGGVFGSPEGRFLPNAEVTLTNLLTHEDSTMITADNGSFRFRMQPNSAYRLKVAHEGSITQTRELSTEGQASGKTFTEDFHLQRAQVDMSFALNDIYFDYDKWDIRPDASVELDKVVLMMQANPHLSFELSAHTDSRGGVLYNLVLSDARAHSAEDYLIRAGVDPRHISSKGFGEERLVNDCGDGINCTEEEHQANRRVELRITSIKELADTQR